MPEVTVVLPVHDAAATLEAALASVRAQTFGDFEVLVVLNGCTDASPAIARSVAAGDRRFEVIERPERGLVAALNAATARAAGALLARLDADDLMEPERLALQREALARHPEWVGVTSRVATVAVDGGPAGAGHARYVAWLNGLGTPEAIAQARFVDAPVCQPAVTLRTEALRALGGYREGPFAEDHDLWLRLFAAGGRLGVVPEVLLTWRDHAGRLTRTDPRFGADRRRALVHRHLVAGPLAGGRVARVWGAGDYGKAHVRGLLAIGVRVEAVLDVDPRKFGRRVAGGVPVVDAAALGGPDGTLTLVAVATPGAREVVAGRLEALGHRVGRDYFAVQ